jgi:hypothetical protein
VLREGALGVRARGGPGGCRPRSRRRRGGPPARRASGRGGIEAEPGETTPLRRRVAAPRGGARRRGREGGPALR